MPNLDIRALRQQIADARLAPIYLLLGEDVKLVDRMVEAIETVVDEADRPFAVEHLYAGEESGTPMRVATAARMMPMLGDRRIVVVRRAERILKPKRAARQEDDEGTEPVGDDADAVSDVAPLEDYLASPVPTTTLVFVASEIDKTRRITKRLIEKAQVVEFGGMGMEQQSGVSTLLKEELLRAGLTIDAHASRLMVERAGGDITKLRGDIERLLLFLGDRRNVTTEDVGEIAVDHQVAGGPFAIVNAIESGNVAEALRETGRRIDGGDSPHALVGQLRWWVATKLAPVDQSRVRPALEALLRTDLALKSSGGDPRILVERLIVELTGRPIQTRGGWR